MAFADPSDKGYYNETESRRHPRCLRSWFAPQFAQAESNIREHARL